MKYTIYIKIVFKMKTLDDLLIFNFIPFEIFLINKDVNLNYVNCYIIEIKEKLI